MTSSDVLAPFYNDLVLSLAEAKRLMEAGAKDRKSASHAPVVATIDQRGDPSQRVMILRQVDWPNRTLRFHTDVRTAKVSETENAHVSVLFYEPEAKTQVRLSGRGTVLSVGNVADSAWEESTPFARRCYMPEVAPGTIVSAPISGLPDWVEGRKPTEAELIPARENFAVLIVTFNRLEWLYLANAGHRRAEWEWNDRAAQWAGRWLIP